MKWHVQQNRITWLHEGLAVEAEAAATKQATEVQHDLIANMKPAQARGEHPNSKLHTERPLIQPRSEPIETSCCEARVLYALLCWNRESSYKL